MRTSKRIPAITVLVLSLVAVSASAQTMTPVVQDTFQRGNESPVSDYGNWSIAPPIGGSSYYLVVTNSYLQPSVAGDVPNVALWTGTNPGPNQYAEMNIALRGLDDIDCRLVRASATVNTNYSFCIYFENVGPLGNSYGASISKTVNGAGTTLSNFTIYTSTSVQGVPIYFRVQGSILSVDYGGSILETVTDTSITSGFPGISLGVGSVSN